MFFQWSFNDDILPDQNTSILYLTNVNASHGGTYTCMPFNSAGNDSRTTEVFISPYFVTLPQSLDASNGSQQALTCPAEAFPDPVYQWEKLDGTIRSGVTGDMDTRLEFSPVMFGDEGMYYCNASSQGIVIQSDTVTVTCKLSAS